MNKIFGFKLYLNSIIRIKEFGYSFSKDLLLLFNSLIIK